jgi:nicotinamide mononucleotide transporter
LNKYVNAQSPLIEAIGTALSIVAVWMLARKFVEHWLVWIIADIIMAVLAFEQARYPSAGLGVFYATAAVFGYFKWKKQIKRSN